MALPVMGGAKVWPLAMVEGKVKAVQLVHSNSHLLWLPTTPVHPLAIRLISNVEEVQMAMDDRVQETSIVTGDSRATISRRCQTNNRPWEVSLNRKTQMLLHSSLGIELVVP